VPVEKRNIFLHETQHALPYVSKRKRSDASFPCRENPKAHAAFRPADSKIMIRNK